MCILLRAHHHPAQVIRLRRQRAESASFNLASIEEVALRELVGTGDHARISSFDTRKSARAMRDTIAKLMRDERRDLEEAAAALAP